MLRRAMTYLDQNAVLSTGLVAVFLTLLFLVLNFLPLWHTDVWAHLKLGQWINFHGKLPEREPFSAWSDTEPYAPMGWLSQSIIAAVYDADGTLSPTSTLDEVKPAGVDALRCLGAVLVMLRFLFLFGAYRRMSQSLALAFLGLGFCFALSCTHIDVFRPQVFGELCLAIMLFATCNPTPSALASWLVPVLLAVWANLHGSFVNGLLVLLGVMASRFFLELKEQRGKGFGPIAHSPAMRRYFRMFYLSILAIGFLNPFWSFRWYSAAWSFASNPNVATLDEWQRLDWTSPAGWAFTASLVVILGTHWLARARRISGISFGHWLLILCFGLQVVFFQRMLPWWAMLAPYVCMGPWRRLFEPVQIPAATPIAKRWMSRAIVLLAAWIMFSWSTAGILLMHHTATPLERSLHPGTPRVLVQATRDASASKVSPELLHALKTNSGPIFCSETLGDYLLFASPRQPIVYTHVQLFPPEHWQKCLAVKFAEPGWDKLLDQWNVNVLLVEADLHPRLCDAIRQDKHWKVLVDEAGDLKKSDPKARHFLAVRR